MKFLFLMAALTLVVSACDRQDKVGTNLNVSDSYDADNTGRNVRDRGDTQIPTDQSESAEDRGISQEIRRILIIDDNLSTNGKNIKIITANGIVTIRGPVLDAKEKEAIVNKINKVRGVKKLNNQLETTGN